MQMSVRTVLVISRPRFWLYLAGPFILAYALGAPNSGQFFTLQFWLYFMFFLVPANIFLYGINDLADTDTDQFNSRKDGYEHALQSTQKRPLILVLIGCVAITFATALITANFIAGLLLFSLLGLSFAYSFPPFRWKSKPFIDSASNILYVIPGIFGYYVLAGSLPSSLAIFAFGFWTAAMHLFSAIPDIEADSRSGLRTTAVVLGERRSLLLCSALWFFSMVGVFILTSSLYSLLLSMYVIAPLLCLQKGWSAAKLYPVFPFLNAGIGFIAFWIIVILRLL